MCSRTWNDLWASGSRLCPHVRKTWVALWKYFCPSPSLRDLYLTDPGALFLNLAPPWPRVLQPELQATALNSPREHLKWGSIADVYLHHIGTHQHARGVHVPPEMLTPTPSKDTSRFTARSLCLFHPPTDDLVHPPTCPSSWRELSGSWTTNPRTATQNFGSRSCEVKSLASPDLAVWPWESSFTIPRFSYLGHKIQLMV